MELLTKLSGKTDADGSGIQRKMQEAQEKVASLQEVLQKLQMTKKFLHLNAVEVKGSINSNMSRLLESLRSREVWLLNQVDVILQTKEDGLRQQEDQLNRAIGQLSNCLSLLEGGASLSVELKDILNRIDSLGKHPVESPHISFRADIGGLRQAIHGFGRVDSKGLPLEAFASPHLCSSSLPKPFEDYEDAEQHVFYKTVHEIYNKKHGKTINFSIPKLSPDVTNWLSSPPPLPAENSNRSASGNSGDFAAVGKSKAVTSPTNRKRPTTACSISQWMKEIKMEEEDDELMTCQLSSKYGNKGLVTSASASCLLPGSSVKSLELRSNKADSTNSLQTSSDRLDESKEGNAKPSFSFLSSRLQDWLIDGETRLPKSKAAGDVPPQHSVATFEPCVFRPTSDAPTKESILESYKKRISALPMESWLAPTGEQKMESDLGNSSLLDNYAKKVALLPWLMSSRGLTKETQQDTGSESGTGVMENYVRKIANMDWLTDKKVESESGAVDSSNAAPSEELKSLLVEGILDECLKKSAAKSWLLSKDEELKVGEDTNSYFYDCMKKIYPSPQDVELLSCWEKLEISSDAMEDGAEENCLKKDEKSETEKEEKSESEWETVVDAGLDQYVATLNSRPLDCWLLPKSTGNSVEA